MTSPNGFSFGDFVIGVEELFIVSVLDDDDDEAMVEVTSQGADGRVPSQAQPNNASPRSRFPVPCVGVGSSFWVMEND